jgi:type VI secretion system protein ImpH
MSHFDELKRKPQSYDIYHALRILEAHYIDSPRLGNSKRSRDDRVRIEQEADLAFPTSSLKTIEEMPEVNGVRVINRVFGLFGSQGPLPLHLTEYARDRMRNNKDQTFYAFVNNLTHRLTGILYKAWRTGQPAVDFDRGRSGRIEKQISALVGLHGSHLAERDKMPDLSKLHFAGHLGLGVKNASGLSGILEGFFDVPIKLERFIGSWLKLEPEDCWKLGINMRLGASTNIGGEVFSRSSKFRIHVGPVNKADYMRFLPDQSSLDRMKSIVRNYLGDTLDWDVKLVLKKEDVSGSILGNAARLGHTTWIGKRDNSLDSGDLILDP